MKIRRYVAKDMRTALAQIKEELGADAVIMSNKKIAEGVELMAAVDYNQNVKPAQPVTANHQETNQQPSAAPAERVDLSEDTVALSHTSEATEQSAPADSLAALLSRQVQQNGYDKSPATRAFNSQIENSAAKAPNNPSENSASETADIEQQFKNFTSRLEQSSTMETPVAKNSPSVKPKDSRIFSGVLPWTSEKFTPPFSMMLPYRITRLRPPPPPGRLQLSC